MMEEISIYDHQRNQWHTSYWQDDSGKRDCPMADRNGRTDHPVADRTLVLVAAVDAGT
jgi:hypothetical protein